MPWVTSDGQRTISLARNPLLYVDSVELARLPTRDEMMKIRCGDVAYAFSKMDPVDIDMSQDELKVAAMPLIGLLKTAASLRRSNYDEWFSQSQLIPAFASAKGPEDIARNRKFMLGYTPFEASREEAERRLVATIYSDEAVDCRDLRIPGLTGTLSVDAKWGNHVKVYLENVTVELRKQPDNIDSLTCRQLLDVVSQLNLLEELPADIFELRELLRDPAKPDDRITKGGSMTLRLVDDSRLIKTQHSLLLYCDPGVVAHYSSGHLEYEEKPRDFHPINDVTRLCNILRAKLELFQHLMSGLVDM